MSQAVAQRDTSRRQSAEESARDRLRATLLNGKPEHEGFPDSTGEAKQQPEYHPARIDGRTGATPSDKKNDDRQRKASSRREEPDDTKLARRKASRREPQHVPSSTPKSKVTDRSFEHLGGQDHPQSPLQKMPEHKRKAADPSFEHPTRQGGHEDHSQKTAASRKRIYCGNNALAHELTSRQAVVGKRSECFRKGYGGGFYATIPPGGHEEFIQKWSAPYRRLVEQPLHYGDGPTPAGKIPATLSQCLSRGFAVGSIQKAKKMRNAE